MLLAYSCLFVAIMLEVTGTMLLPASQNFSRLVPTIVLVLCYAGAFYLLTFAIQSIPLAIVYATWSGLGVFTIAVLGYFLFSHSLSWQAVAGLCLIVVGVMLVNIYSPHR